MPLELLILERMRRVFDAYPEILAVYLFGSRGAGAARSDSDYDLAVVSDRERPARPRRIDILADLARAGLDNVDLSFLDHDNVVLHHEAVRLNQLVFSRPPFDHGSFYSRVMRLYFVLLPHLNIQRRALKERLLHGTT